MISDDPPPISNMTIERASRSARSPTPAAARWASVSRSTISSSSPSRSRTCSTKSGAVDGGPAGLGGDGAGARHAARRHFVAADRKASSVRSIAASLRRPVRERPSPKPDDAGKGVDHPKAVRRRAGDQEPAIIRAEIQRCIGRSPVRAPRLSPEGSHAARRSLAGDSTLMLRTNRKPRRRPRPAVARASFGFDCTKP